MAFAGVESRHFVGQHGLEAGIGMIGRGRPPLPREGWARLNIPLDWSPFAAYPLALSTVKSALHFLNFTYANLPRQLTAEGEPRLEIHRQDASLRKIAYGDFYATFVELACSTTIEIP